MIRVRYEWDEEVGRLHLSIRGHAGSAPAGRDLVCAGASMLAYTALEVLQEARDAGEAASAFHREERGRMTMGSDFCDRGVKERVDAVCTGFRLLAERYPQYVRFEKNFRNGEKTGETVR